LQRNSIIYLSQLDSSGSQVARGINKLAVLSDSKTIFYLIRLRSVKSSSRLTSHGAGRSGFYTPFTRWSKLQAVIKQMYSKYTCTTCAL